MDRPKVFLDTSVLFAAVLSETGGSRHILKLGEAGAVALWVGPGVLREADAVLTAKSPRSRPLFALLLNRARVQVGSEATPDALRRALTFLDYAPDAQVLAEGMAENMDYLVSLDRQHLVGNPRLSVLPFPVGTPGDFLAWLRARLVGTPPAPGG